RRARVFRERLMMYPWVSLLLNTNAPTISNPDTPNHCKPVVSVMHFWSASYRPSTPRLLGQQGFLQGRRLGKRSAGQRRRGGLQGRLIARQWRHQRQIGGN